MCAIATRARTKRAGALEAFQKYKKESVLLGPSQQRTRLADAAIMQHIQMLIAMGSRPLKTRVADSVRPRRIHGFPRR